MSEIEWTDAEASDLEDLAINLGHIDDNPEVILSRTREIDATVRPLMTARLAVERDRADRIAEECRFLHQEGMSRRDHHLRHCGAAQAAEAAEARADRAEAKVALLTHLLGSHADGHRCTCTMTDPGTPGVSPPEWEQDPWCPTHPDMTVITAEVSRLAAKVARVGGER